MATPRGALSRTGADLGGVRPRREPIFNQFDVDFIVDSLMPYHLQNTPLQSVSLPKSYNPETAYRDSVLHE